MGFLACVLRSVVLVEEAVLEATSPATSVFLPASASVGVLAADCCRDTGDVALNRLTASLGHDSSVVLGGTELRGESAKGAALGFLYEEEALLLDQTILLCAELDCLIASAT